MILNPKAGSQDHEAVLKSVQKELDHLKIEYLTYKSEYKGAISDFIQNENLSRESFLGTISPVTGFMITADNATYFYKGFQIQNGDEAFKFTPSFTPGLYFEGDGKDLGHIVEFKSEIQLSVDLLKNSHLGVSYNHISNASLGDKNPGANSYMFNFLKRF